MLTIFYDGQCGLCHRTVQFLLGRDPKGNLFRYAALQGITAEERLPPPKDRPDSVAVLTEDNTLLVRGDAAILIGKRLGGIWYGLAWLFSCLPSGIRDRLYGFVAEHRYRLFGTKEDMCPLISADQQTFFLP